MKSSTGILLLGALGVGAYVLSKGASSKGPSQTVTTVSVPIYGSGGAVITGPSNDPLIAYNRTVDAFAAFVKQVLPRA